MTIQTQMQLEETLDALKNAEAAGDADSARILADRAERLKQEIDLGFKEADKSSQEASQRVSDSPITAAAVGAVGGALLGKPTERLVGKALGAKYSPYGNVATGEPPGWKWARKVGYGAGLGETVQEQVEDFKSRNGPQTYNQPKNIRKEGKRVERIPIPGKGLTIEQSMANAERDALEARVKAEAAKNAGKGAFWKAPSGFGPQVATVAGKALGGAGALGMGAQAASDFDKMVEALKKREFSEAARAARSGGLSTVGALGSAATFIPHPLAKGVGTALGVAAPLANAYLESKGYAKGGTPDPRAIKKDVNALMKRFGSGSESLPPAENAARTQIIGTLPTYRKAAEEFQRRGMQGRGLDFGAGLGEGAKVMPGQYETYEPFARGWNPTYSDISKIPQEAYNRLTNLNVLNVVPRGTRNEIVEGIGKSLEPGGMGLITTRGADVMKAAGRPGPEPMSVITSRDTYQKGFTNPELQEYLKYILGPGYDIERLNIGPAGAAIRKKADGGLANMAEGGKTPTPDPELFSAYEFERRKEGRPSNYNRGTLSRGNSRADIDIASDNGGNVYQNYYRYSDPEAAQRDYENLLAESEMRLGLLGYAEGGKTPAWQRAEGKNPEGGLNAKGRASYKAETGGTLKRPQPEGGARRDSFCARMTGMKKKLTSAETANDPDSRINKSLRKWNC